jgi:hypothetical protein
VRNFFSVLPAAPRGRNQARYDLCDHCSVKELLRGTRPLGGKGR